MKFADLGLSEDLLKAVADVGYDTPTPIQAQAIPSVMMARDILGCAQTGTGKTASFTLPMLDILHHGRARMRMPRSIILEPTRELATQVADNFDMYGKYMSLSKALIIGGESVAEQSKILEKGVDVLIATPGRLIDTFERGKLLLSDCKLLVIDEADRMLDMGFIPDIEKIVAMLPKQRQTLLFSATMPKEIKRLADKFLSNPKEITVAPPSSMASTVEHTMLVLDEMDKRQALRQLIRSENVKNAFVFCNRKKDVDILFKSLTKHGFNAGRMHGDMAQSERTETLDRFKSGDITLLICSDVAARGIDIADVSHVFNFDVPFNPEDYVHRTGRTGRAGKEGRAFTLAVPEDGKLVAAINKTINMEIPITSLDGIEALELDFTGKKRRKKKTRRTENNNGSGRNNTRNAKQKDQAPVVRDDQQQKAAAKSEDKPAPQSKPSRHSRHNRYDRDEMDDNPVIGFGDHVPAFLLTEVPASSTGKKEPEKKKVAAKKATTKRTPRKSNRASAVVEKAVTTEPEKAETPSVAVASPDIQSGEQPAEAVSIPEQKNSDMGSSPASADATPQPEEPKTDVAVEEKPKRRSTRKASTASKAKAKTPRTPRKRAAKKDVTPENTTDTDAVSDKVEATASVKEQPVVESSAPQE